MRTQTRRNKAESPYSAALCIVMLLAAGMLVKFAPALQLVHIAHN